MRHMTDFTVNHTTDMFTKVTLTKDYKKYHRVIVRFWPDWLPFVKIKKEIIRLWDCFRSYSSYITANKTSF